MFPSESDAVNNASTLAAPTVKNEDNFQPQINLCQNTTFIKVCVSERGVSLRVLVYITGNVNAGSVLLHLWEM